MLHIDATRCNETSDQEHSAGDLAATAHDADAERYVIGSALVARKWASALSLTIRPSAFYLGKHARIWESVCRIVETGDTYDPLVVAQDLTDAGHIVAVGGAPYLYDCMNAAVIPENASHQAKRLLALASKRDVAIRLAKAQHKLATADPDSVTRIVSTMASDLAAVASADRDARSMFISGGAFLLDVPSEVPAIWGRDRDIFWARGESLVIAGPQGTGKTTIAGQLLRSVLGLDGELFGYPVNPCDNRVLYLAMDRPQQARRCLGRMFREEERSILEECLVFWQGPPPEDAAENPQMLLTMARQAEADFVFVDSIKDAAIGLSDDRVGAGYNRARQLVIQDGRQIVELHHTKKTNGEAIDIDSVYGSTWLTSGAGSVILLSGSPGDPIVGVRVSKKPMNEIAPFKIQHDPDSGKAKVWHDEDADVFALARRCASTGLSLTEATECLYRDNLKDGKATSAQKERARRVLARYVTEGLLIEKTAGKGSPSRWFAVAPDEWGDDD